MNNSIFVAIILIMTLVGCGGEYPRDLIEADSIADGSDPKQAIDLLDGLKTSARSYSVKDKYYYELLKIKAADKARIKHTSDSMILEIIDYYEFLGDKALLPMAYYYGGRVYRNLGDAPQALTYFQKCMEHPLLSDKLRASLFLQMGELYVLHNAFDLAIETHTKSYEYCREAGDSIGMVYSLIDVGYIYECIKQYDNAKDTYKKALSIACDIKDKRMISLVYSQLSMAYLNSGDNESAKKYLDLCRESYHPDDSNTIEAVASLYYSKIGDVDSIKSHIDKALNRGRVYDKIYAYKHLMRLAQKERNIEATMVYLDSFLCYKDSVAKIEDAEHVRQLKAQYDYSLREKENARLESDRKYWQIVALICSLSVVILAAIIWIYRLNYRRKKVELELAQRKINEVEEVLVAKERADAEQRSRRAVEVNAAMARLCESEIYVKLLNIQRGERMKLSDEDWNAMSRAVNEVFPNFDVMLNKFQNKLTKNEYRMTLLLKMQFPVGYIAQLLNKAPNTVSTMRKRVYEKMFLMDGDSASWDYFVARL